MIDPQNQALTWLMAKERDNLPSGAGFSRSSSSSSSSSSSPDPGGFGGVAAVTDGNDPHLKEILEFSLSQGKTLILSVDEKTDPVLDPVLDRRVQKRGKTQFIVVGGKKMDFDPRFKLLLFTRLANPSLSPELQAHTTLIDFTVTQHGLEEQLLARVIQREQKALEEQLDIVVEQVTQNTKSLLKLDTVLLQRLTSNDGNLLDDDDLVGVLKTVKDAAEDVKKKLTLATDTKAAIEKKREQYRPVATRGAVLYFSIVDVSNVNCMYVLRRKCMVVAE